MNYYNPRVWLIENPQTGMLKDRPFMVGLQIISVIATGVIKSELGCGII
jgi:hypothetical protein